jgi:hypothetical protein
VTILFGGAGLGLIALVWVIRRILHHFNARIEMLESQMNVLLPPVH